MKQWVAKAINYQVNLRAIASREPRNPIEAATEQPQPQSILAYLTEHLHHIADLGISLLHLMPPFPIGLHEAKGIGSPYAVRDYRAVHAEYGTLDELRALITRAHEHELKVILGMVPNHTSRDNTWIETNPEYYVRDEQGNILYDLDWSDTAKLNYHAPSLCNAMTDVYDYWLSILGDDGVDGFRIDMAHFINNKNYWNHALPELKARHPRRELLFMAECYGMNNNLDLFQRGMNAAYDDDFYKVAAFLYGIDHQGQSIILPDHEQAEGHHDFNDKYQAFKQGGIAAAAEKAIMDYERVLPTGPQAPRLARYMDNHDEGRGLYRFGPGAMQAMMQTAFFAPHSLPFLLAGQEYGATNRPPIHERIMPCGKGHRALINGQIVQREGVEFEGNLFARHYEERQVWKSFYKTLIQLRREQPALIDGTCHILNVSEQVTGPEKTVLAFARQYQADTLHAAINLGPEPRTLRNSHLFTGHPLYGQLDNDQLAPFSAILVRR